jgi:uncharacterized protein
VLDCVADYRAQWRVSPAVLAEYEEVLRRPKFSQIPREYIHSLLVLAARANLVNPDITLTVSPDEPDNRLLECAEAANADYLVTGNTGHFPKQHGNTEVVTPRQFLIAIRGQAQERR